MENSFEQAIQAYLENYAQNDPQFATKYANPDKSLAECCKYIMQEMEKIAREARNGRNMVGLHPSDETVYGLAVHYYDEADLKVDGPTVKCVATGSETPDVEVKPEPKPRTQKAPKKTTKKASKPKHEVEVKDDDFDFEIPDLELPNFDFPIF